MPGRKSTSLAHVITLSNSFHGDGNHCISDCHSGASSHRKTPLGTPLVASAGRCFSPLSVFQTPPIKEEEWVPAAAAEPCDLRKVSASLRLSVWYSMKRNSMSLTCVLIDRLTMPVAPAWRGRVRPPPRCPSRPITVSRPHPSSLRNPV